VKQYGMFISPPTGPNKVHDSIRGAYEFVWTYGTLFHLWMTIVSIFQTYVNGYYRLMATKHLMISYYDYGIVYYMDLMEN
jgi:hypothetical protein